MAVAMTVAAGAAAGVSPPAPVIQADSRDDSATIFVGTGASGTGAGTLVTVTFGGNYSSPIFSPTVPKVSLGTAGASTNANIGAYISAANGRAVTIACTGTPGTGLAATSAGIVLTLKMDT